MKSTVQLMAELARHNQVLYVDYPFTLKDLLNGIRPSGKIPVLDVLGIRPRLAEKTLDNGASVQLLRLPPFIPANWLNNESAYDRLLRWNARLALPVIRRAMHCLGLARPVVINAFNPAFGNALAGRLGEKLLVYYCYDEICAAGWISKHGKRHEAEFMQRAGLTVVSSAPLFREKSKVAKCCGVVKNGVSPAFFQPADGCPDDMPSRGSGAIIGYLGSVDERLDYALLEYLATVLPQHQFVFVGRIMNKSGISRLECLPNVSFLGPRPPSRLPAYLSAFTLGVIPFAKTPLTAGIYPLKANEYLAMGKAVVSTDFSDLSDFEGVLHVSGTYEGFRLAIEAALATDTEARQNARRAIAHSNSWANRAEQFGALIMKALERGNSPAEISDERSKPGCPDSSGRWEKIKTAP